MSAQNILPAEREKTAASQGNRSHDEALAQRRFGLTEIRHRQTHFAGFVGQIVGDAGSREDHDADRKFLDSI